MPGTAKIHGVPIVVREAKDDTEALQAVNQFQANDPEGFQQMMLKLHTQMYKNEAVQQRTQQLEGMGTTEKFMVGAGFELTDMWRGARQLVGSAMNQLHMDPKTVGVDMDKLAADEVENRRLFNFLDNTGIGAEDAGQLFTEALAFVGGGSTAVGERAIVGALRLAGRGAALGAVQGRTKNESALTNAIVGGATAGVTGFLGLGAKWLSHLTGRSAAGAANALGAIAAAVKGNEYAGTWALSRMFTNFAAGHRAFLAAIKATPDLAPAMMAKMKIAGAAQDVLAKIITGMRGQLQQQAGNQAAESAFRKVLGNVTTKAQNAYQKSFIVAKNGTQLFNAPMFLKEMGMVTDKDLGKLGMFGQRLKDFRKFAKIMTEIGDVTIDEATAAFTAVRDEPGVRAILNTMAKSELPTVKAALWQRLVQSGYRVTHEATKVPARMMQTAPVAGALGVSQEAQDTFALGENK